MSFVRGAQPTPPIAYPTQSAAAAMLGIAQSTLSRAIRRHAIVVQRAGDRDRHVAAADVLRLNAVFRRTIAEELAGELVAYATARAPSVAELVVSEVTTWLDESPGAPHPGRDDFLDELRRVLPAQWYLEVERVYRTTITRPVAIVAVSDAVGGADAPEAGGPPAPVSAAG